MDNKKDNLNFNYKKISDDEILFDNVHNTNEKDFNKKEIITEMIKGNISDLVKNQLLLLLLISFVTKKRLIQIVKIIQM